MWGLMELGSHHFAATRAKIGSSKESVIVAKYGGNVDEEQSICRVLKGLLKGE